MNKHTAICASLILALGSFNSIDAGWKNPMHKASLDRFSHLAADYYNQGINYLDSGNTRKALNEFRQLVVAFPNTSYALDAYFFLGVCYFRISELDNANEAFSKYLECQSNPEHFQETIDYKFQIAECFKNGAKGRLLGSRKLPKWSSCDDTAISIYEEVISAAPNDDIAAYSLFSKAGLLCKQRDFKASVEAYQMLIGRFPKNELAPESYLMINRVFLDQCQKEFQNPDLLAFAEINLHRFEEQFPAEERLEQARNDVLMLKEIYAQGVYETACFYERLNQPRAAIIYYQKAIVDFPETNVANHCRQRLSSFCPKALVDIENG